MLRPYNTASLRPPPFLRKKLTVIGMIGHTHGVKIANNPPNNPNKKINHSERSLGVFSLPCAGEELCSIDRPVDGRRTSWEEVITSYSHTSGAVHILSSQALKRIGVTSLVATIITNESAYSSSNSRSPNSMIFICQPGSICALIRTLSPTVSPLHFTGSTICAIAKTGQIANNILTILFIVVFIFWIL